MMVNTVFEMNDKGDVLFLHADMREALKALPENSVDSVVTDPPYHLQSIVKRFSNTSETHNTKTSERVRNRVDGYARLAGTGFMGARWDGGDIAFQVDTWREVMRVLKPGGHLAAFGGTRTFARMSVAIEDAGFEIRDTLMYLYGVGFPKSHSISRALEKELECELKNSNAYSVAESSSQNGGVGAKVGRDSVPVLVWDLVSEGDRLEYARIADASSTWPQHTPTAQTEVVLARFAVWGAKQNGNASLSATLTLIGRAVGLSDQMVMSLSEQAMAGIDLSTISSWNHLLDGALSQTKMSTIVIELSQITGLKIWNCLPYLSMLASTLPLGTALKPAVEPVILARKPLSEKTVVANVLRWRTGAINIDGCRIPASDKTPAPVGEYSGSRIGPTGHKGARDGSSDHLGRWPANLVHDGSDEVVALFPSSKGQQGDLNETGRARPTKTCFGDMPPPKAHAARNDSGSAARFFYAAKASRADRAGSRHPTIKPISLMRWLTRLITPPGGLVLDPFAGSGTTGAAALEEGMRCLLIEREAEYADDIRRRLEITDLGLI